MKSFLTCVLVLFLGVACGVAWPQGAGGAKKAAYRELRMQSVSVAVSPRGQIVVYAVDQDGLVWNRINPSSYWSPVGTKGMVEGDQ